MTIFKYIKNLWISPKQIKNNSQNFNICADGPITKERYAVHCWLFNWNTKNLPRFHLSECSTFRYSLTYWTGCTFAPHGLVFIHTKLKIKSHLSRVYSHHTSTSWALGENVPCLIKSFYWFKNRWALQTKQGHLCFVVYIRHLSLTKQEQKLDILSEMSSQNIRYTTQWGVSKFSHPYSVSVLGVILRSGCYFEGLTGCISSRLAGVIIRRVKFRMVSCCRHIFRHIHTQGADAVLDSSDSHQRCDSDS